MNLESVTDFKTEVFSEFFTLKYINIIEIVQGGPEIGQICLNGSLIGNSYFGGPLLFNEKFIFIPMYSKSFLRRGFKLVKISILNGDVVIISKIESLILLNKIDESFVYYSIDTERVTSKKVKW